MGRKSSPEDASGFFDFEGNLRSDMGLKDEHEQHSRSVESKDRHDSAQSTIES